MMSCDITYYLSNQHLDTPVVKESHFGAQQYPKMFSSVQSHLLCGHSVAHMSHDVIQLT